MSLFSPRAKPQRRSDERFVVNEIVRIERDGVAVGLGRLTNLSLSGAYLETPRRAQRRGRLRVRPTSLDRGLDDTCWIEAEVVRRGPAGVGLRWRTASAPVAVRELLAWQVPDSARSAVQVTGARS